MLFSQMLLSLNVTLFGVTPFFFPAKALKKKKKKKREKVYRSAPLNNFKTTVIFERIDPSLALRTLSGAF